MPTSGHIEGFWVFSSFQLLYFGISALSGLVLFGYRLPYSFVSYSENALEHFSQAWYRWSE
jgi:hypothetical protein